MRLGLEQKLGFVFVLGPVADSAASLLRCGGSPRWAELPAFTGVSPLAAESPSTVSVTHSVPADRYCRTSSS